MKKILSIVIAVLAVLLPAAAASYEYPYLSFTDSSAQVHSIGVDGLSVHFADGKLIATNGTESLELPLADLAEFHFAKDASALREIGAVAAEPVKVHTVDGIDAGTFGSCSEAAAALAPGLYIISNGRETVKILVK